MHPWAGAVRRFYANAMPAGDLANGVPGPIVAVREHAISERGVRTIRERLYSREEAARLRDELSAALRAFELAEELAESVACRRPYPFRDHRTMEQVAAEGEFGADAGAEGQRAGAGS